MSKTDDIRRMYGEITAPEDAVMRCLDIGESKRVVKFPVKRVAVIAACIAVILGAVIPAGAYVAKNGFGAAQKYGEEAAGGYPHKVDTFYKEIDGSSLLVTEGSSLSDSHQGLEIKVDEAYYDGAFMYVSFTGQYDKSLEGIDRFSYDGHSDYVKIEGADAKAELSGYSFAILNSGESLGGVLGFICPYDRDELEVEINIPYLQIRGENYESMGEINESFELSFAVKKSAPSTLVYNAEASKNEVSVLGLTASKGGVCVELFIPTEVAESKAGIMSMVENEQGEHAGFIMGKYEETEGGFVLRQYFEPIEGETLSVKVYDKNNMDAGTVAEFVIEN